VVCVDGEVDDDDQNPGKYQVGPDARRGEMRVFLADRPGRGRKGKRDGGSTMFAERELLIGCERSKFRRRGKRPGFGRNATENREMDTEAPKQEPDGEGRKVGP
jgi:hypothetical protein